MTIDSEKGEKLSSFVDGELSGDHCESLINAICKDEDMKSCLERYQMISDSMKSQLPDGVKSDFVQCVMSAIESEPTVISPAASTSLSSHSNSNSSSKSGNVIQFPSLAKKVAGFAIAASVATIAVIGVQTQNQEPESQVVAMPENSEFVRLPQQRQPVTASIGSMPASKQTSRGTFNASTSVSQQDVPQLKPVRKFDPILHQYIVNHSQFASGSGVQDIISHARIVASSQKRNSVSQVQR